MNFASVEKRNQIAIIWLDEENSPVNKISLQAIEAFYNIFKELEADSEVKACVLISKKKDFIAGADIEMFGQVKKKGDFEPITRKGHRALNELSASKKPVVAAIHGACLGAGTEIALACHARIASDDRTTHIALPEVMLGLLPGGGGTQRLPRLIGIQRALDILLTGKKIYAHSALKLNLVDRLVPRENLLHAAIELALEISQQPLVRKDKRSFLEKLLESNIITRNIIFNKAKEMVLRKTMGNYPAPLKILECVQIGMNKGFEAGLNAEAEKFEELILTNESRQLIHIFFAMTEKKKNPYPKEWVREVNTIGMIGAGFMGAGIAEVSANDNMKVILKDIKEETIAAAKQTIWKNISRKVARKIMTAAEADSYMSLIKGTLDYSDFKQVDLAIEAVFEEVKLKQRIVQEVETHARPDTIFASNTSALPIAHIAEKAARPELIIGMHYFSPVPKMPLLEIVKTNKTADWVIATCFEVGIRQGKTNIVVNDGPGFYTTRILAPYFNEALLMLNEGCDAAQVDKAMKKWGFPVGPITLLDEVGLDVGAHVMSGGLIQYYMQRPGAIKTDIVKKMYDSGRMGKKNKKGFFKYDKKGKKIGIDESIYQFCEVKQRKAFSDEQIQLRLSFSMIKECLLCLEEKIIESPLDGDVGAIFGLGFPPFRGGPFRYLDYIGLQKGVDILNRLSSENGVRFSAPEILKHMAQKGETFYRV
jgi:fatty acid oxidation complex alpha subunit FadJ